MPKRKIPFVNGEIYHVFNRSVAQQPIFRNKKEYDTFTGLIEYYHFRNLPHRYSHFTRLNREDKVDLLDSLYKQNKILAEIIAFSLMPNHHHLLLRQCVDGGIMNYIRLIQNSYARYLNTKTKRCGSLFQTPFRAVRIENDEQLIHVVRYIHLNPLTSYILNNFEELEEYEWTSYKDYVSKNQRKFINTLFLMKMYKSKESLKKFTRNNLDYQRKLEKIKHLIID